MPPVPDLQPRIGTLEAGVVVLVPVLVGGTCVQLSHRTFLLSHPKGGLSHMTGTTRATGLAIPHGDRRVRKDQPSGRHLAMMSASTGLCGQPSPIFGDNAKDGDLTHYQL